MCLEDRPILEPNAAGIDIGSREIFVAVPPHRDPNPVRVFPTFTENLQPRPWKAQGYIGFRSTTFWSSTESSHA